MVMSQAKILWRTKGRRIEQRRPKQYTGMKAIAIDWRNDAYLFKEQKPNSP